MPGMATSSPPLTSCGSNATSSSAMIVFRYISSKLAHRNIHLDFILDDSYKNNDNQGCILIPLRPLTLSEQTLFTKISSSARAKFPNFRVQSRSLDRGALASASFSSSAPFLLDTDAATAAATNKQSRRDSSLARTRTKHEYIFEVVDPIHLLHQSNILHHVVFRADGLLVLSIDSSPSNDGEEGEEFILHSFSTWSSLDARRGIEGVVGEEGDMYDSPIYGFGLRDYFRNNPRLGRADGDVPTTIDNNPSHESEHGMMRRRRNNDNINTAVQRQSANRKEVARRPMPSYNGKEPSSSASSAFNINNNNNNNSNRAYPLSSSSLLQTPPVTASYQPPHHHHHQQQQHHHRHAGSSCSNNKILFEFALSEYPLYRRDSGLGAYTTAASSTAAEGYDPLNHLMEEEMGSAGGGGDSSGTTMILGSEWEAFRRIGLGVGG